MDVTVCRDTSSMFLFVDEVLDKNFYCAGMRLSCAVLLRGMVHFRKNWIKIGFLARRSRKCWRACLSSSNSLLNCQFDAVHDPKNTAGFDLRRSPLEKFHSADCSSFRSFSLSKEDDEESTARPQFAGAIVLLAVNSLFRTTTTKNPFHSALL